MKNQPGKKLFTRGELITLTGVVLSVMSAAMTWANLPPKTTSMVAATYVATYQKNAYLTNGYGLKVGPISVGWLVVLAGIGAGTLLLFQPIGKQRQQFLFLQVALAILILMLAARHLNPYPGVLMALGGAAALLWGGMSRYGRESPG
jgi:hypothetical protein